MEQFLTEVSSKRVHSLEVINNSRTLEGDSPSSI